MTPTNVHLINHTHWDREWFLTSVYTSRWIPGLIDKLEQIVAQNPDYRFLFDGQTLTMEDLLTLAPAYASRIRALVAGGNLILGPYYCQPDWQLTSGELLIRNLLYGQQDLAQFGGAMHTGWLVDTFGHISQARRSTASSASTPSLSGAVCRGWSHTSAGRALTAASCSPSTSSAAIATSTA